MPVIATTTNNGIILFNITSTRIVCTFLSVLTTCMPSSNGMARSQYNSMRKYYDSLSDGDDFARTWRGSAFDIGVALEQIISLALTIGGESRVVTGSEQLDVHLELKSRIAAREISPLLLMQTKRD